MNYGNETGNLLMAFAASNLASDLTGYFVECDHGQPFEYKQNPYYDPNYVKPVNTVLDRSFPHLVFVGPHGDQVRYALVLKTVVYIVVDEIDNDEYVTEKWKIKKHRSYKK